jgi:hypothetical protein
MMQQRRSLAQGHPGRWEYESGRVGYQDNVALTQLGISYLPEHSRTFRCEVVALRILGICASDIRFRGPERLTKKYL